MIAEAVAAVGLLVAPPGFYEARVLEPAASYVAGKPATVYCASSDAEWGAYVGDRGDPKRIQGLTTPGSSVSRLPPVVCRWLRNALRHTVPLTGTGFAASATILVHESIHQRGEKDEGKTECAAIHELPGVVVRYFAVKPGRQLRALMNAAWAFHRLTDPALRTVC